MEFEIWKTTWLPNISVTFVKRLCNKNISWQCVFNGGINLLFCSLIWRLNSKITTTKTNILSIRCTSIQFVFIFSKKKTRLLLSVSYVSHSFLSDTCSLFGKGSHILIYMLPTTVMVMVRVIVTYSMSKTAKVLKSMYFVEYEKARTLILLTAKFWWNSSQGKIGLTLELAGNIKFKRFVLNNIFYVRNGGVRECLIIHLI